MNRFMQRTSFNNKAYEELDTDAYRNDNKVSYGNYDIEKPDSFAAEGKDNPLNNLFDNRSDLILKGFIYSEIFGPPKSKRKGR